MLVTELNKFGFIVLLHLRKEILPRHVAEYHFRKHMYDYKIRFYTRQKDWCIDTKNEDQESILLF